MSLELTHEDMMEAAARGFERVFSRPEYLEMFAESAAEKLGQMFELLSPEAAAGLLGKGVSTLRREGQKWGLDKSVAFGGKSPIYFLSQIVERAKQKIIRGRASEPAVKKLERRAA